MLFSTWSGVCERMAVELNKYAKTVQEKRAMIRTVLYRGFHFQIPPPIA